MTAQGCEDELISEIKPLTLGSDEKAGMGPENGDMLLTLALASPHSLFF